MNKKKETKLLKNEKGFTLIEIIAVIIIMGILASVAVPKYFNMQEDAKRAALNGALSEASARFNHAYARYILDFQKTPSDVATDLIGDAYLGPGAATTGEDIGDFDVTWQRTEDDELTITVLRAANISVKALDEMTAVSYTHLTLPTN